MVFSCLVTSLHKNTLRTKFCVLFFQVSGNIEEKVTIVNSVYATIGAQVAVKTKLERNGIGLLIKVLKDEKLFITKPVKEILFDGYEDPILSLLYTILDPLSKFGIKIPGLTSRLGLFFGRNNTWYSDGITNIHTGVNSLNQLGQIASFNHSKTYPYFKGECAKYKGSPELFPPYLDDETKQFLFNPDLCRTMELTPARETEKVKGTIGSVYVIDETFFANASINPENQCFGLSQIPSGLFDASACRFEAPIFMSQPHFYQADPYYQTLLGQPLKPNKTLHETKFVFETVSGVPMKVSARFQVNVKLDQIEELDVFKNLPKITYLPMAWFDTSMELPKTLTSQMWYLSNLKAILISMGSLFICIGIGVLIFGYFKYYSSISKGPTQMILVESSEETTDTEEIHTETTE